MDPRGRSLAGGLGIAVLLAVVSQARTAGAWSFVDWCKTKSPDGFSYILPYFPARVGFESDEAAYYYASAYETLACDFWVVDFYLSPKSNQCDLPSEASCGAFVGDGGWDVPSSAGSTNDPDLPLVKRDCKTYRRDGKLYYQPSGGKMELLGTWQILGVWTGTSCTLSQSPTSTIGPETLVFNTSGQGWDRYRVATRLRMHGSGQQTWAYAEPGVPR
jgi:hypothetical protein